jgi:hypothetical protein
LLIFAHFRSFSLIFFPFLPIFAHFRPFLTRFQPFFYRFPAYFRCVNSPTPQHAPVRPRRPAMPQHDPIAALFGRPVLPGGAGSIYDVDLDSLGDKFECFVNGFSGLEGDFGL